MTTHDDAWSDLMAAPTPCAEVTPGCYRGHAAFTTTPLEVTDASSPPSSGSRDSRERRDDIA